MSSLAALKVGDRVKVVSKLSVHSGRWQKGDEGIVARTSPKNERIYVTIARLGSAVQDIPYSCLQAVPASSSGASGDKLAGVSVTGSSLSGGISTGGLTPSPSASKFVSKLPQDVLILARALESSGMTPEDLFKYGDLNSSGRMTIPEFKRAIKGIPMRYRERTHFEDKNVQQSVWNYMQKEGRPSLSASEFCSVLRTALVECAAARGTSGGGPSVQRENSSKPIGGTSDTGAGGAGSGTRVSTLAPEDTSGGDEDISDGDDDTHDSLPSSIDRIEDDADKLNFISEGPDAGSGRLPRIDGDYTWIRKANSQRDRAMRRVAKDQTIEACQKGCYKLDGVEVTIRHIERMLEGTCIILATEEAKTPDDVSSVLWFKHPPGVVMEIAVERAEAGLRVAAVNAASAYHAGGGFLGGGRHALEESFCVQSTLFRSLLKAKSQAKAMNIEAPKYAIPPCRYRGEPWDCHIPENGVVLSPNVEVFRGGTNDGYPFFDRAVELAAIVSVAMPNANPRMRDAPVDVPDGDAAYHSLIVQKCKAVLVAAVRAGAAVLVMCDAGCGVYMNNPEDIGRIFGELVQTEFPHAFKEIHLVGSVQFNDAAKAAGALQDQTSVSGEEAMLSAFRSFDENGDGLISREELYSVFQSLDSARWSKDTVDSMLQAMDSNLDGVDYTDLVVWLSSDDDVWGDAREALAGKMATL